MKPTFWDLLTLPTPDLRRMGLKRSEIAATRERMTGHFRRLSPQWVPSIGCWGGVATLRQISERVGYPLDHVKGYASAKKLKPRTKKRSYTQAQLGVLLYTDRDKAPKDSCRRFGVLPCERVLYLAAIQVMLDAAAATIVEALDWTLAELEAQWTAAGVEVGPPQPRTARTFGPDELRRMLEEARKEMQR